MLFQAVFAIDRLRIKIGKQPALGLSEVQVDARRREAGGQQLPAKHQPRTHMDDIRKLLAAGSAPASVNLHLAQAKCRLFPDLDPETIYLEYGLGDGQG